PPVQRRAMKHLPFIWKHLWHNKVRSASTVAAMAVCILLLCILESLNQAIVAGLATAKDSRLITRHNVSLVFPLPMSHRDRIIALPGVRNVSISNWFGGVYQDRKNFFPNFAVDLPTYLDMYPEYIYRDRIIALPGVRNVSISNWFGGVYQDRKNFFPNFAVDLPTYLDMYPEY